MWLLCYGLYISVPQQEYVWGAENRGNILIHMWFILHFNSMHIELTSLLWFLKLQQIDLSKQYLTPQRILVVQE
jgi:hypothetical protein